MSRPGDKVGWRSQLLARRRARSSAEVAEARGRIAGHLAPLGGPGVAVCGYLPLSTEPLDPGLPGLLAALGTRVLVPVAVVDSPLDWCVWDPGAVARGSFGIDEPTGPRLGPAAITTADVVLVPALAVDRRGVRLGRGGGHYDRSLALLDRRREPSSGVPGSGVPGSGVPGSGVPGSGVPRPRLIAVIFDDELVDALPRDARDRPVTEVVTPGKGIRRLDGRDDG